MSRTQTPAPLSDRGYWRKLLARCHPDSGGTGELFVWAQSLREAVEGGGVSTRSPCGSCEGRNAGPEPSSRVPFDPGLDHHALTLRALTLGRETGGPAGRLLAGLTSYPQPTHGRPQLAEGRGASYRQLKFLAVLAGIPARELYAAAEQVPLSQAHASHLIDELKDERGRS